MSGCCPACGRRQALTPAAVLPPHRNLGLVPCAGADQKPTGGAGMTAPTLEAVRSEDEHDQRSYPYPPTGEELWSVTTVIGGTDSKPHIRKWYGKTAMAYAVDHLFLLGRTLRKEGRDAAISLGKDEAERLRKVKADAGTHVHDVQEALIMWAVSPGWAAAAVNIPLLPEHLEGAEYDGEPIEDVIDAMVAGFIQFVADFRPQFLATEMPVYNQPLGIAGTLDMIVALDGYAIRGGRVVASPGSVLCACIDTKSGKSPDGTWKEQLAAYRRMTECRPVAGEMRPMPATRCGAVLHLRPEYPDGYLLMVVADEDDEAAWVRFQDAVRVFTGRQKVKDKPGYVLRALREDGTLPGPRLCDLAAEGYGNSLAPLRKALGADCELDALAGFTAAEVLATKGIGPKHLETVRRMLREHGRYLKGEELLFVLEAVIDTAEQEVA